MGVEMQVFLIPRANAFRPDARALASFVGKLREADWACDPGKPWFPLLKFDSRRQDRYAAATGAYVSTLADGVERVKTGAGLSSFPNTNVDRWFADRHASDLMIVWPVETLGEARLQYPLDEPSPCSRADTYYDLQLWLADDYVYKTSESIDPFEDERCSCGADLVHDPEEGSSSLFHAPRMRTRCGECGTAFDPSEREATLRNPMTNEESSVRGGATFRFALVIDCGKCWPNAERGFGVHPELRALCESHFDQPFYQVLDVY